jgi:hypothetical protein
MLPYLTGTAHWSVTKNIWTMVCLYKWTQRQSRFKFCCPLCSYNKWQMWSDTQKEKIMKGHDWQTVINVHNIFKKHGVLKNSNSQLWFLVHQHEFRCQDTLNKYVSCYNYIWLPQPWHRWVTGTAVLLSWDGCFISQVSSCAVWNLLICCFH